MFERSTTTTGWGRCTGTTPSGGRFTVQEHGAQITEWVPMAGARPVLWLSPDAIFAPKIAIRGGIPVCFPWFGAGRKGNKSPAHGFARLSQWQMLDGSETEGVTTLRWRLDQTMLPDLPGVDPHRNQFTLTATHTFGRDLTLTMRLHNIDDKPLVVEQALHTYLHVGDIHQTTIHGLAGTEYLDQLTGVYDTQIGPLGFSGETDRIHWVDTPITVHDPVFNRRITLTSDNAANAVIWNPWVDKTAQFNDIPADGWQTMVCVESANVRNNAIHLTPGQSHELTLTLAVSDL